MNTLQQFDRFLEEDRKLDQGERLPILLIFNREADSKLMTEIMSRLNSKEVAILKFTIDNSLFLLDSNTVTNMTHIKSKVNFKVKLLTLPTTVLETKNIESDLYERNGLVVTQRTIIGLREKENDFFNNGLDITTSIKDLFVKVGKEVCDKFNEVANVTKEELEVKIDEFLSSLNPESKEDVFKEGVIKQEDLEDDKELHPNVESSLQLSVENLLKIYLGKSNTIIIVGEYFNMEDVEVVNKVINGLGEGSKLRVLLVDLRLGSFYDTGTKATLSIKDTILLLNPAYSKDKSVLVLKRVVDQRGVREYNVQVSNDEGCDYLNSLLKEYGFLGSVITKYKPLKDVNVDELVKAITEPKASSWEMVVEEDDIELDPKKELKKLYPAPKYSITEAKGLISIIDNDVNVCGKYPHYRKDIRSLAMLDTYVLNSLFDVKDSSGAIQHVLKKLLVPGIRGAKSSSKDKLEALETLLNHLESNNIIERIGEMGDVVTFKVKNPDIVEVDKVSDK